MSSFGSLFSAVSSPIFFKTFFSEAELSAEVSREQRAKRGVASLKIPTMIPIYRMTFRIPAEATPGMKFNLIPGFKYGRRLTFHDGNSRWLYYPTEPIAETSSSELVVLAVCAAALLYFAFFSQGDPFGIGVEALDVAGRAADFLH